MKDRTKMTGHRYAGILKNKKCKTVYTAQKTGFLFIRAFYEDEQFCGVLYTVEDNKYIIVLYLAVNDQINIIPKTE